MMRLVMATTSHLILEGHCSHLGLLFKGLQMKYYIYIFTLVTLFSIFNCTENARPFELLLGIAPMGEVDFEDLIISSDNRLTITNLDPGQISFNDVSMAYDKETNSVILLSRSDLWVLQLNLGKSSVTTNNTYSLQREYSAINIDDDNIYYLGENREDGSFEFNTFNWSYTFIIQLT